MLALNYVFIIVLIIGLGIIYQKYLEKKASKNFLTDYNDIQKYLLDENSLQDNKKPIIWIHIPFEYNARYWESFGSRSSLNVNQPYLHITVRSIIKNCDNSFKICLIDDNSFEKLIPGWSINMSKVGDPVLCYLRQLGLAKLVYRYGGMVTPISFLCFKDLDRLYNAGTSGNKMFVCENVDMNSTSVRYLYYPDVRFMGAPKENAMMLEYIHYMERTISKDYTSELEFLGEFNRWCNEKINAKKMRLIPGTEVGTKMVTDEPVLVEKLLGDDYIEFFPHMYGIWIPDKVILKRVSLGWFTRMSVEQILESRFILAKYMFLAMATNNESGVIEGLQSRPDWINFWRVPSQAPIWGPMPQNLGNNVPEMEY
jgi:hypothetical protein